MSDTATWNEEEFVCQHSFRPNENCADCRMTPEAIERQRKKRTVCAHKQKSTVNDEKETTTYCMHCGLVFDGNEKETLKRK